MTPPITQNRVVVYDIDGYTVCAEWVCNHEGAIYGSLVQAHDLSPRIEGASVAVEGRRRLNDYVGSPQWSPWEATTVEGKALA